MQIDEEQQSMSALNINAIKHFPQCTLPVYKQQITSHLKVKGRLPGRRDLLLGADSVNKSLNASLAQCCRNPRWVQGFRCDRQTPHLV